MTAEGEKMSPWTNKGDGSQETGSVEGGNERREERGGGGRGQKKNVKTEEMLCFCCYPLRRVTQNIPAGSEMKRGPSL